MMNRFISKIATQVRYPVKRFSTLSSLEKRLFIEAVLLTFFFRLIILTIPFRKIAPFLGKQMIETSNQESPIPTKILLEQISRSIHRASRFVPWQAKCLVQAMTGKTMLRKRDMESTLYLGLAKEKNQNELIAHAWLRCGNEIICGGIGLNRFTIVAYFGPRLQNQP